tara:strand:+ start:185 stop:397 length:213 start_codon:yes stop_codon:yes gene_type:complete
MHKNLHDVCRFKNGKDDKDIIQDRSTSDLGQHEFRLYNTQHYFNSSDYQKDPEYFPNPPSSIVFCHGGMF